MRHVTCLSIRTVLIKTQCSTYYFELNPIGRSKQSTNQLCFLIWTQLGHSDGVNELTPNLKSSKTGINERCSQRPETINLPVKRPANGSCAQSNAFLISQETSVQKSHPSTCIASNLNFEKFRKSENYFGRKVWKDFQNEFLGRLWSRVRKNFNFGVIFRLWTKVRLVI